MELVYNLEESIRLDLYLSKSVPELSRSRVEKMIEEGDVLVNSKLEKRNYKLKCGDVITYTVKEAQEVEIKSQDLGIEIVYEDENVAVIYKRKGMVVHPGAGNYENTLVNGLLYQLDNLSGINGELRPGIVHRIDKDTTGLLLVAKTDIAHKSLSLQLQNKTVRRVYYAIVEGVIKEDNGLINAPIGRDDRNRMKMAVKENGKEAITTFHVLKRFKNKTYIECVLKTGRTHQIRVHMAYINHPVYGDPLYARKTEGTKNGQYLHAGIIGYNDPITNEYREFSYPLPEYFQEELDELERKL
ncbi:MAG: RluA family pseudouridine synthase [Gammaproteobacteria bacterium]|nr:RluA family pseudouridine synthase [Gammaproteobacteria bacterium]